MTTKRLTGKANPNWRGGRYISSSGYVLVRDPAKVHRKGASAYSYEHRLVAEKKLGRKLKDDELVHHLNENKQDNRQENIEVVLGNAGHFAYHRKRIDLRSPEEENPTVICPCGCGKSFLKYDESNRPRAYLPGHNPNPHAKNIEIISKALNRILTISQVQELTAIPRNALRIALSRMVGKSLAVRTQMGVYGPPGSKPRGNPQITCMCGCGKTFAMFDRHWRQRKYLPGHNSRRADG